MFSGHLVVLTAELTQFYRVFATRVKMTTPQWAPSLRRFVWQRFAENTVPRTLEYSKTDKSENTKVEIPWPKPVRREPIKRT